MVFWYSILHLLQVMWTCSGIWIAFQELILKSPPLNANLATRVSFALGRLRYGDVCKPHSDLFKMKQGNLW